jgi:hypothetical protein
MRYGRSPYRGDEYRKRAAEARTRADTTADDDSRAALLQIAETWERMARWEDENNRPSDR